MKVAVIGLGNMGIGIAKCIQRAGHDLTVWNRTPAKSKQFEALGAYTAPTIREVSETAEIIITSLMDDASVLDVVKTKDGMLEGMSSGAIHACVTTISPTCADELERVHREHGSLYVSAPVIGRPDAAASGRLVSLLAGPSAALTRLPPVCKAYSESIVDVAERPRLANVMKLAVNYNVASTIEMISETYIFAEKSGLPLEPLRDFYQMLWFAHPAAKLYADKLLKRDFAGRGGFVMTGGLKDVRLMLSAADECNASLKIGKIVEHRLAQGVAAGMGEQDWSSFHEIARQEAGLK